MQWRKWSHASQHPFTGSLGLSTFPSHKKVDHGISLIIDNFAKILSWTVGTDLGSLQQWWDSCKWGRQQNTGLRHHTWTDIEVCCSSTKENFLVLPFLLLRISVRHHCFDMRGRAGTLSRQSKSLKHWCTNEHFSGQGTQFYKSEQMYTVCSNLEASVTDCISQSFVLKADFLQLFKSSCYYKRAYHQAGDCQSSWQWESAGWWSKRNPFSKGKELLMWNEKGWFSSLYARREASFCRSWNWWEASRKVVRKVNR